ncbi:MAG: SET domain-containing protein-lysine N-methyltransferase [Verrucomicrobia bacterium]|nr:SET domain-containing protein-lysine N-methyltransferase [Verrucomicrobiota bacterium]
MQIKALLHQHMKNRCNIALFVSKKLYKVILEKNKEIALDGIFFNLQLAEVHPEVGMGVFLKPEEKSIEVGSFLGVYAGIRELVEENPGFTTAYAYNIAKGVNRCSIQVNALNTGNFTRFMNHSFLKPNVKPLLSKLPGGRVEILFFALKRINPGEQLLVDYGDQYWQVFNLTPVNMIPTSFMLNSLNKVMPVDDFVEMTSSKDSKTLEELALKLALLNYQD